MFDAIRDIWNFIIEGKTRMVEAIVQREPQTFSMAASNMFWLDEPEKFTGINLDLMTFRISGFTTFGCKPEPGDYFCRVREILHTIQVCGSRGHAV